MATTGTSVVNAVHERSRLAAVLTSLGRIARMVLIAFFGLFAAAMSATLIAVYTYPYPLERLQTNLGGPLRIVDRHGDLLRSVPNPQGRPGRESWVALKDIPSAVLLTVIESEDQHFFAHGGVDAMGIARAVGLNLHSGRMAYGGSTITMQLARMMHSPGRPRTLVNKIREAIWAFRLERAVDKRTILEHYLNRAYYGNGAYGIEAAAQFYFGKPAVGLSLGEATFVAILPRAPTAYNPVKYLDRAVRRRDYVLGMLEQRGLVSADTAARARAHTIALDIHKPPFHAPHFSDWVHGRLPAIIRARGGVVRTTLDLSVQQELEHRVREHVATLAHRNVGQAGAVVLDTASGEILAMVGSIDYHGEDGQINIITRRRHPGSALKPFVYALAIEAGDSPSSIAYDLYDDSSDYTVVNRTQPERGPVRYREALAGSYNMAAVDVLERVGISRLMSMLRQAGVGPLDGHPEDYGLRLALGSAKVRLLDLAAAYGFTVRAGKVVAPIAIVEARSDDGRVWRLEQRHEKHIASKATSWMIMDMLADPEARRKVFGHELPVDLPYRVAVKTGTARGFADTVAVGVTSEFTVAAWAGNFDGTPTQGMVAMKSAAPLVRAGLLAVSRGRHLTLPRRPEEVQIGQVCPLSGKKPSAHCPHRKVEYYRRGQILGETCDWHRQQDGRLVIDYPSRARDWAVRHRLHVGQQL
ncbi:MAG: transglycosylase domain-containing protein [Proteobacteria bacterium]|nr:transglycosylase domain-containing protein [Pseudomonadota bacterium]